VIDHIPLFLVPIINDRAVEPAGSYVVQRQSEPVDPDHRIVGFRLAGRGQPDRVVSLEEAVKKIIEKLKIEN
jgi:hypothetical protein